MKHIFSLCICILLAFNTYGQENFNLDLVSNIDYSEEGNDIWGWVSETGTEYAIVGTVDNTRIYDLTDPTDPREVIVIPGRNSIWRDMKSWEDHIYVTNDQRAEGMLVIDMSEVASDSIRYHYFEPEDVPTSEGPAKLGRCHNIYIDEAGYAYLAGCRDASDADLPMNKAVIFDLNVDKWMPPVVGVHGDGTNSTYAHDLYVRDNIMYSSEIYKGAMVIWDVSDKDSLVFLGEATTSFEFAHNIWISDDGNYAFTTDERDNAFVDAYDISDFSNIKRVDMFQPLETVGRNVVPHNTHFINDFLVTSWYTDGVVITDVSRPDNMIKVGCYDTYSRADGRTQGCWGAYPWLPSGNIIANDRTFGFFVLKPNYIRACYLEGVVTDIADGGQINGASVEIAADQQNTDKTNARGEYKTGIATAGTYLVKFQHPQYVTKEVEASIVNGELTILDVQLERREKLIEGKLVESETGNEIMTGLIRVKSENDDFIVKAKVTGEFNYYANDEPQQLIAGSWGHKHKVIEYSPSDDVLVIELDKGYQDDFTIDFGWSISGDKYVGNWTRGIPIETRIADDPPNDLIVNIGGDIDGDIGEEAYVTGNRGGSAGLDDVDATVILRSPHFDISEYLDPVVQFNTYFFNAGGSDAPNDEMDVSFSDGSNFVLFTSITENTGSWADPIEIKLKDLELDLTKPLIMSLTVRDNWRGHLVEAGIDAFKVVEGKPSSNVELAEYDKISIFPNPTSGLLNISTRLKDISSVSIYNAEGKKVKIMSFEKALDVSDLESGLFLLIFERKDASAFSYPFIKK